MRELYKPIGFANSVVWLFALTRIVARRVFWYVLLFGGVLISFLLAW